MSFIDSAAYTLRDRMNRAALKLRRHLRKIEVRRGRPRVQVREAELRFYQLLLSRLEGAQQEAKRVYDVGCRNWSYARALRRRFPRAELVGIELDPGPRHPSLFRREDFARAFASDVSREGAAATFHLTDFLNYIPESQASGEAVFCFFFPFVSARPCMLWGLPGQHADFGALLNHALEQECGNEISFVSSHQGEWEAEIARKTYSARGISVTETILEPRDFAGLWPSPHPVHVLTGKLRRSDAPRSGSSDELP